MNIIEGIQKECTSARELLIEYEKIPTGGFGAMFIKEAIKEGEAAIASRDTIRMIGAYKELEGLE